MTVVCKGCRHPVDHTWTTCTQCGSPLVDDAALSNRRFEEPAAGATMDSRRRATSQPGPSFPVRDIPPPPPAFASRSTGPRAQQSDAALELDLHRLRENIVPLVVGALLTLFAAFALLFFEDSWRSWVLYGMGVGLVTGGGAWGVARAYEDERWGFVTLVVTLLAGIAGGPVLSGLVGLFGLVMAFKRGSS